MTALLVVEGITLLFLFACSAFFSSSETALFSLDPLKLHRIRKARPQRARQIEALMDRPEALLSTILIGNTLVNVAAASLGFAIAETLFPSRGEAIAIPAVTICLLILGEVAPKRLAMSRAARLAVLYAPVLKTTMRSLTPLRILLEKATGLFRRESSGMQDGLTEDEFLTVVEVGEEEGVLDEEERTMVDGIIRLEETQASDVMTPRVDLIGIDLDDPPEEQRRTAESVRFRYLPVYRETPDNPEGFLDVPRFLLSHEHRLEDAMVPPFAVPETVPLDTLLTTFQKENRRVAFVVDEYGGTAGLVTRGDILEEIVADVDNEYTEAKLTMQQVGEKRWLLDGSMSLEDINYELDTNLEAEGADRIAGWVSAQAERIPRTGESFEAQGVRATVQRVRRHRITLVLLEKLPRRHAEEAS